MASEHFRARLNRAFRFFYPDAFAEPNPQLEFQPYPGVGRSFFGSALVRY